MKKLLLGTIVLCGFCHSIWANTDAPNLQIPKGSGYVGIGGGATFPKVGHDNFVNSGPDWPRDRYRSRRAGSAPLFTVFGGYTWVTRHDFIPFCSLGGSYTYVFPTKVKGSVLQYSLPQFENYAYQYIIQRQTFLVVAKADLYRWANLMPFFSIGGGFSANSTHNYAERALPNVTPRISPRFKSKASTHYSYIIGTGFDYFVKNGVGLSLEYTYGYFGHAKTREGSDDHHFNGREAHRHIICKKTCDTHLHTKLNSNTVILSLNYFLDDITRGVTAT
jgi:opacity protein-like surface antigen